MFQVTAKAHACAPPSLQLLAWWPSPEAITTGNLAAVAALIAIARPGLPAASRPCQACCKTESSTLEGSAVRRIRPNERARGKEEGFKARASEEGLGPLARLSQKRWRGGNFTHRCAEMTRKWGWTTHSSQVKGKAVGGEQSPGCASSTSPTFCIAHRFGLTCRQQPRPAGSYIALPWRWPWSSQTLLPLLVFSLA